MKTKWLPEEDYFARFTLVLVLVPARFPSSADDRKVPVQESGNGPPFFSGPVSTGKVYGCFEKRNFGPNKVS